MHWRLLLLISFWFSAGHANSALDWQLINDENTFPPRADAELILFQNQWWLIGGGNGYDLSNAFNDAWQSTNLREWTQVTANTPFPPRHTFGLVEFDGKLFVLGGVKGFSPAYSDVWSSADGINWTTETLNAGFGRRTGAAWGVINGRIIGVGGGLTGETRSNQIFHSSNGRDWQEHTPSPFGDIRNARMVNFNHKLYLLGGIGGFGTNPEIWETTTGLQWTRITQGFPLNAGFTVGVASDPDRVWVLQDHVIENLRRLWSSTDMVIWTRMSEQPTPPLRGGSNLLSEGGRLWLLNGTGPSSTFPNQTWLARPFNHVPFWTSYP